MTRFCFALFLLAAAAMLSANPASQWDRVPAKDHVRANPLAAQPDAVTAGALLYRDHCLQCHKADARGDNGKRPSLRSARLRSASEGDIEWFLRQGELRKGMPSWSSLPQAQRWQIVAYLKSIQ